MHSIDIATNPSRASTQPYMTAFQTWTDTPNCDKVGSLSKRPARLFVSCDQRMLVYETRCS